MKLKWNELKLKWNKIIGYYWLNTYDANTYDSFYSIVVNCRTFWFYMMQILCKSSNSM